MQKFIIVVLAALGITACAINPSATSSAVATNASSPVKQLFHQPTTVKQTIESQALAISNSAESASYTYVTTYNTRSLLATLEQSAICPQGINAAVCSANKAKLRKKYKFDIDSSKQIIANEANAYRITYITPDVFGAKQMVSGGIIIPHIAPAQIKGVVLYYHPTEITKYQVPSCFFAAKNLPEYCNISENHRGSSYAIEMGAIFASRGYIVVMPDYLGQGLDSRHVHPFVLYPEANAWSGINMLPRTRELLSKLGYSGDSLNLYLAGFSEGGAYALWASKLLQTTASSVLLHQNMQLKMTAGLSGAYDLSHAQLPMEVANTNAYPEKSQYNAFSKQDLAVKKPILVAYMLTALGAYAMNESYSLAFNPKFMQMQCGAPCLVRDQHYTIDQLYMDSVNKFSAKEIATAVGNTAFTVINPRNHQPYGLNNNSATIFAQNGLLQNKTFIALVQHAGITQWKTITPVELLYLDYDSVVTNLNSLNAYTGIINTQSAGGLVKKIPVSNFDFVSYGFNQASGKPSMVPIDHSQSSSYLLIIALHQFDSIR